MLTMAWYRNYYKCARCQYEWQDEWSCNCDDDCPHCDARHVSPHEADDLTEIIEQDGDELIVRRSPQTAGHYPDYRDLARFATLAEAEAFLTAR